MIRILLDECLPVKLKFRFQEMGLKFQVSTVTQQGWTGIKNGKLLEKAEHDFDVFITVDQSLSYPVEHKKLQMAKPCSSNELSVSMQHCSL